MSAFDLSSDLVARLDRLVPAETGSGDWRDVVRRLDSHRGVSRPRHTARLALALAALVLVVVAVAAAAYLVLHHGTTTRPRPGALTVTVGGYNARWPVKIVEVLPNGRTTVIWRCPNGISCGEPEGVDWSSDGRHVAFTLAALNVQNDYLGLHILDIDTGRDVHPLDLDCRAPAAVAWSPDGRTLAFDCGAFQSPSQLRLVAADGSNPRRLPTGSLGARWPSWSPDGTHLAFAASGAIYTVRLDGTGLRRLTHGSAPAWSPDGRKIAYRAPGGVRLVTPGGRDVTPARKGGVGPAGAPAWRGVGPAGAPAWSPDGRELAIATYDGLYVVDSTGRHLRLVRIVADVGSVGPRPAWYPSRAQRRPASATATCGPC